MAQLENPTPCLTSLSLPQRLWYHWQLSAWYLLLLKHFPDLTHVHLTFSLPFSPTYLMPVLISIFPCQLHMACTHTLRKSPHTHTHLLAQTTFAKGKQQKWECWLSCYFQTYQCSSGAVICVWLMSHWMSEGPLSYRPVVSMCAIIQQHSNCSMCNSIKLGKATEICLFCWHDCQPIVLKCSL